MEGKDQGWLVIGMLVVIIIVAGLAYTEITTFGDINYLNGWEKGRVEAREFNQDQINNYFKADYLVQIQNKSGTLCIPWNFDFKRDNIEDWVFTGVCPELETHNPEFQSKIPDSNLIITSVGLTIYMKEYQAVNDFGYVLPAPKVKNKWQNLKREKFFSPDSNLIISIGQSVLERLKK